MHPLIADDPWKIPGHGCLWGHHWRVSWLSDETGWLLMTGISLFLSTLHALSFSVLYFFYVLISSMFSFISLER